MKNKKHFLPAMENTLGNFVNQLSLVLHVSICVVVVLLASADPQPMPVIKIYDFASALQI